MIEVVDMWTKPSPTQPAAAGYGGGRFAFVGPGWKGTLPPGVERIDSPREGSSFSLGSASRANTSPLRAPSPARHHPEGLAEYTGQPGPPHPAYHYDAPTMTAGVASSHMKFDDPLQFWSIFSNALNENPPPASEIEAVLPSLEYLGLKFGEQWQPDKVPPVVLAQMKKAAANISDLALGTMPLPVPWPMAG